MLFIGKYQNYFTKGISTIIFVRDTKKGQSLCLKHLLQAKPVELLTHLKHDGIIPVSPVAGKKGNTFAISH